MLTKYNHRVSRRPVSANLDCVNLQVNSRYVKLMVSKNGKFSILARIDSDHGYVQVDVRYSLATAKMIAHSLKRDKKKRTALIYSKHGINWRDGAPMPG